MSSDDDFKRALAEAHAQLLERDQIVHDLRYENDMIRHHLDSVLSSRAWKLAECYRRARSMLTGRQARDQ